MENKTMRHESSTASTAALAGIPEQNIIFDCHLPHAEILDSETGMAWHSLKPISREDYEALSLPEGMHKVGIGTAVCDLYYFRRSPGADSDGPVGTREIDGHLFIHNANQPLEPPKALGDKWPLMIRAVKYHTLVYAAGSEIDVIRQADGKEFVELIAPAAEGGGLLQAAEVPADINHLDLPEGWTRRTETISADLVIHLPYPTVALFFPNGASYQGPVDAFNPAP